MRLGVVNLMTKTLKIRSNAEFIRSDQANGECQGRAVGQNYPKEFFQN